MSRELAYFDNAATSFPKPPEVARAMAEFLAHGAVNPGRSGFDLSLATGRLVDALRRELGEFFGNPAADPDRTVFTANATDALNLALQGLLRPGDHVVGTVLEHNSVLRPLTMLRRELGIDFDLAPCDGAGFVAPDEVAARIRPQTRLVVTTHASNVLGTIQPVAEIARRCRERGVPLLLDAAQSAGLLPVDMAALGVDLVAFTGHKSLLGPTGTGGLVVGPDVAIRGTRWGGTGVRSAELTQPQEFPYRLEAGTLNTVGLAGLRAGLAWVLARGPQRLLAAERALADRFLAGIADLPGLAVMGHPAGPPRALGPDRLPVVSLTLEDKDPAMLGAFLDADWDIAVRTGLQCAPLAHAACGTAPAGTLRFSFGPFNTNEQVDRAVAALGELAR